MPALSHADIAVASAIPTCANIGISESATATLTTTAPTAILTGVAVSSRAKKPGASALIST